MTDKIRREPYEQATTQQQLAASVGRDIDKILAVLRAQGFIK